MKNIKLNILRGVLLSLIAVCVYSFPIQAEESPPSQEPMQESTEVPVTPPPEQEGGESETPQPPPQHETPSTDTEEYLALKNQINELNNTIASLQAQLKQKKAAESGQNNNAELQGKIQSLTASLKSAESRASALEKSNTSLIYKNDSLSTKNNSLENQIISLKTQIKDLEKQSVNRTGNSVTENTGIDSNHVPTVNTGVNAGEISTGKAKVEDITEAVATDTISRSGQSVNGNAAEPAEEAVENVIFDFSDEYYEEEIAQVVNYGRVPDTLTSEGELDKSIFGISRPMMIFIIQIIAGVVIAVMSIIWVKFSKRRMESY